MGNLRNKQEPRNFMDMLIDLLKVDDNQLLQFYIINNFYDEIESSLNNNTDLNIKNLVKQLSSFCLSEKFFIYLVGELKDIRNKSPLSDFIIIYEKKKNIYP